MVVGERQIQSKDCALGWTHCCSSTEYVVQSKRRRRILKKPEGNGVLAWNAHNDEPWLT